MAKKDKPEQVQENAEATEAQGAQQESTEQKAEGGSNGQGAAVVLPNGVRRIDYIRDNYYDKDTGVHNPETCKTRGQIRKEINDMYDKAGEPSKKIAYQIVFAATKTKEDPRRKAAAAPQQEAGGAQAGEPSASA